MTEDRDLWKQSEATCRAQYDKLLAEHEALKANLPTIYIRWSDDGRCIRKWSFEPFELATPYRASAAPATSAAAYPEPPLPAQQLANDGACT